MPTTVTGSPIGVFANAIFRELQADVSLNALVGDRIYDDLPRESRPVKPYVVVGDRSGTEGIGAMTIEGVDPRVTLHVWSSARGAHEAHLILSAMRRVLQRKNLTVDGFLLLENSVTCEDEQVFREYDTQNPDAESVYHGLLQVRAQCQERI